MQALRNWKPHLTGRESTETTSALRSLQRWQLRPNLALSPPQADPTRMFVCNICNRTIKKPGTLATHERSHLPWRWKCHVARCSHRREGFRRKAALLGHIERQHPNASLSVHGEIQEDITTTDAPRDSGLDTAPRTMHQKVEHISEGTGNLGGLERAMLISGRVVGKLTNGVRYHEFLMSLCRLDKPISGLEPLSKR
jgi:hypothetical protein